jgi:hypothetical protein
VTYSVMVWLVDPGEQAHQEEAMRRTTTGRSQAPGAASGVNEPPAFTRMVYGVYESLDEANKALSEISNKLQENEPLEITSGVEHANGPSSSPPLESTTSSATPSSGRGIGGVRIP